MSSGQADRHIRNAEHAASPDNKLENICDAVKELVRAVRELESKVSRLESR